MSESFTTKERKKAFDRAFKDKIVLAMREHGFQRHTRTSKRLYKNFAKGLSVFIFFEFKTFGDGFYDINIVYFDEDIGDVYSDEYIAMANIKKPEIEGNDLNSLNILIDSWIDKMTSTILPFIEKHSSHQAILQGQEKFYFAKSREVAIKDLLENKN